MPKWLLQISVYPLILINIALGFLMFILSHQLILLIVGLIRRGGFTEHLGPFLYVQSFFSSAGAIILALAALILFPLLERYYYKVSESAQALLLRFLCVMAIQIIYISCAQILTQVLVGIYIENTMLIALFLLASGAVLFNNTSQKLRQ